jgi:hypothetical protein
VNNSGREKLTCEVLKTLKQRFKDFRKTMPSVIIHDNGEKPVNVGLGAALWLWRGF